MKNTKFIFDVDGTLTPSRQKIDSEFSKWFLEFCINNDVYLVTGSDYPKTVEQLGEYLCRWPIYIYNCSGNEVWAKGEKIKSNEWIVPDNVKNWLNIKLKNSRFSLKTGIHIEERTGCINFSIIGRNATLNERKLYIEYDLETEERKKITTEFNHMFGDLEARIGGETGIDIYPRGRDKGQIITDFDVNDKLYFFGDKIEPGGNDWPLAHKIQQRNGYAYNVKNWQDTLERLQYLQESKIAK